MIKSFQHITTLESTQGRSITWSYTYLVISVLKTLTTSKIWTIMLTHPISISHKSVVNMLSHVVPVMCVVLLPPLSQTYPTISPDMTLTMMLPLKTYLPFPSSMAMIHFLWAEMITLWISCNPMCSNPYQIQLPWPPEILSLFPIQSKLSQPSKKTLWELQPPSYWY